VSIVSAGKVLEDLLVGLDQAYRDANNLDRKDCFQVVLSALPLELAEPGRLSVQV